MIVGHFPAGYLAAVAARKAGASRAMFWGVLAGSVLPDLDMLWFVFVDQGAVHHHTYLTHRPIVWALVLVAGCAFRSSALKGIGLGGLVHMCLDTIAGAISWGWPYTATAITLVEVQPTHDHWVKSFMAHWTFQVEIAVVVVACIVFLTRRRRA